MENLKLSGLKNKEDYLKLSEFAKKYDHSKFFSEIKSGRVSKVNPTIRCFAFSFFFCSFKNLSSQF